MLAQYGLYALPDSAGPRVLDPAIQTGPTVILPLALVFRLFGIGLLQARIFIIGYAFVAVMVYATVARRLLPLGAMLLAILLLLIGTRESFASFIFVGRQVLGEVPALCFYLLGVLFWWRTLDITIELRSQHFLWLTLAGLAWGLAMCTKSQLLLLLPIALGILAIWDQVYYRQQGWFSYVFVASIALGCVAGWYAVQIWILGLGQFHQNSQVLREGFQLHVLGLNPVHWRNAVGVIWRSGWWLWGVPGLIWGVRQAIQSSKQGYRHASVLVFVIVSGLWFLLLSVGWSRYAFYIITLTPIWTAGLVWELWHRSTRSYSASLIRWMIGVAIVSYLFVNGATIAKGLLSPPASGFEEMRSYLLNVVSSTAVIESWEWEMSVEPSLTIHHPSTSVANAYTAFIFSEHPLPPEIYDPTAARPDYILIGPFGHWTGIYDELIPSHSSPVASFGNYVLFSIQR
jgi:hypothetical protein